MNEIEKVEQEIAARRALRRALYRWVAAIREALLKAIKGEPSHRYLGALSLPTEHQFEIIKRDLNQCERMLTVPDIDYDPVLEIWRKDGGRANVLWFDFAPPDSDVKS